MKPLESNPFIKQSPLELEKAKSEIKEFIEHECEFAELPIFYNVAMATSIERYKKACRILRVRDDVEIRQSKGRIIACKTHTYYLKKNKNMCAEMG